MKARKPADYELMFQSLFCQQRVDARVVQLGDDPRETLTAAECRWLAKWLAKAAAWIEEQEGGR